MKHLASEYLPMTLEMAATFLNLPERTVKSLASRGHIPYYQPDGFEKKQYFRREDLVAWAFNPDNRVMSNTEANAAGDEMSKGMRL